MSEAKRSGPRKRLAHLFDPVLAVHTLLVEPLPHQITAVYEAMLPRQPLRFLLADDPGAGKTIMAGLFIKELVARGDLQRCLVVCPGNLTGQTPSFDEFTVVLRGRLQVETRDAVHQVSVGQAIWARSGEWIRYSTPGPEGAEYIAVCMPAFSPETVHRDEQQVI